MTLKLRPYPAYKDSGVPWLGEVPEHWETVRLGRLIRLTTGLPFESAGFSTCDSDTRLLRGINIAPGLVRWQSVVRWRRRPDDSLDDFELRVGDLVLGMDRPLVGGGIRIAMVQASDTPSLLLQRVARLRPTGSLNKRYVFLLLSGRGFAGYLAPIFTGISVPHISPEQIRSFQIALPPLNEQASIVSYLARVDRRIARLIRAKQRLIELLNEEGQAIINRAVTRGLDPNVRLKPSGIEWIGEVPEHWAVTKLYRITAPERPIMYGIVLPGPNVDVGVFIVKGGNCEPGRLRPACLSRTTFEIEAAHRRSRLAKDDIVYSIRGSIGAAELVPEELVGANLTQDAARISPRSGIHPRWLLHAVRSRTFFLKLDAGAVGATIRGINIRDLKRAAICLPPLEEQVALAAHLDREFSKLDDAVDRAHRHISLLREYRTRLIADVVTGKLDVRGVELPVGDDLELNPEALEGPGDKELQEASDDGASDDAISADEGVQ